MIEREAKPKRKRGNVAFHAGRLHALVKAIAANEDELQKQLAEGPVDAVQSTTGFLLEQMLESITEIEKASID